MCCRPHFGSLSPALRQRAGGKELLYHRVQAAYRSLLAQVGQCGWPWHSTACMHSCMAVSRACMCLPVCLHVPACLPARLPPCLHLCVRLLCE